MSKDFLESELENIEKNRKATEARLQAEKEKRLLLKPKRNKLALICTPIAILLALFAFALFHPPARYQLGKYLFDRQRYNLSERAFEPIADYQDSQDYLDEAAYGMARELFKAGKADAATEVYLRLVHSPRTTERATECKYLSAIGLLECKSCDAAIETFAALDEYKSSLGYWYEANYQKAVWCMENKAYADAIALLEKTGSYSDSNALLEKTEYSYAVMLLENKKYREAINLLVKLKSYEDCPQLLLQTRYDYGVALMSKGNYEDAINQFDPITDYEDASDRLQECRYQYAVSLYKADYAASYEDASALFKSLGNYKHSAAYYNNCLCNMTLQVGEAASIRFRREAHPSYNIDAQIRKIIIEKLSSDTVRFHFEFGSLFHTERIQLFSRAEAPKDEIFRIEKNVGANDTSAFLDVPLEKIRNAISVWAIQYVSYDNSHIGTYFFLDIDEIKAYFANDQLTPVPIPD